MNLPVITRVKESGLHLDEFRLPGQRDPIAYTEWSDAPEKAEENLRHLFRALLARYQDDIPMLDHIHSTLDPSLETPTTQGP